MDNLQAAVLAIVQGITEFLPVSSSAHLILVPQLLGWNDQGLAFDVAVHVGTLVAVIAFLRPDIMRILPAWFAGFSQGKWNQDGQLGWMVVLATIPVGLVGLLAGGYIEQHLRSIWVIAATTAIFGLALGVADINGDAHSTRMRELTWQHTLMIGVAQAIALIPGTSRSGITMTAMLLLGYSRTAAARFSFLLAVPAIALPGILKSAQLLQSSANVHWLPLFIGTVVSAIVAFWCMRWFMALIQSIGMRPFVIYRLILAVVIVWVFS